MTLLTGKDFLKAFVMRCQQFALKCIAVKIIPFLVASIALFCGKIDSWIWLGTGLLFVAARLFEKIFVKDQPTISAGGK
jgi:hypothetical protein